MMPPLSRSSRYVSYSDSDLNLIMRLTFRQPYYMELIDEYFPSKVIKW